MNTVTTSFRLHVISLLILAAADLAPIVGAQEASPETVKGLELLEMRKWDAAIDILSTGIRKDPKDIHAYYYRGITWRYKGELDKAISDFTVTIKLRPMQYMALMGRAEAWNTKGETDKAIADYSEAIRLHPKLLEAYRQRSILYVRKNEFDLAIADLDNAIAVGCGYASP